MPNCKQNCESLVLRVLWMALFVLVWQVAELTLLVVVVVQLLFRLFGGAPNAALMGFGDSLSQYLAQIGRFGCFNSDEKPWPFSDWPTPRPPQGEAAAAAAEARPASPPVAEAAPADGVSPAVGEPAAQPEARPEAGASSPAAEQGTPDAPEEPKA